MPELAIDLTPGDVDDRLDQAEAAVRSYCGWHIAPSRTETVRIRDAWWLDSLILPSLHVTAVVSVIDADNITLQTTKYDWTPEGILWARWGTWPTRYVDVTFTHGYADPPADVTGVVQALAQRGIDGTTGAVSWSKTAGPFVDAVNYGSGAGGAQFLAAELATLDRYKLPARP